MKVVLVFYNKKCTFSHVKMSFSVFLKSVNVNMCVWTPENPTEHSFPMHFSYKYKLWDLQPLAFYNSLIFITTVLPIDSSLFTKAIQLHRPCFSFSICNYVLIIL